jgi:hypothetical protein
MSLEVELDWLKGEIMLQHAAEKDEAEKLPSQVLELRAAMNSSRPRPRPGKKAAAHQLLAPIYGWFTEGVDTADVEEAAALLQQLP